MKFVKKLISTGFVYVAIATLIAQVALLCYFWIAWGIDWSRGQDAVAVLRGNATVEPTVKEVASAAKQVSKEQPSFEEVLQARALKTRDFELRAAALSQGKVMLRQRQEAFARESSVFNLAKSSFEQQVANYEAKSRSQGIADNISTIQDLEPELAKAQLLKMYDNEMESLIGVIKGMEPMKSTEILNLFTSKDDKDRLAEILRRIRDGFEYKPPIDNTTASFPPEM